MKALLPFTWDRLESPIQQELEAFRSAAFISPFLQPRFHVIEEPRPTDYLLLTSVNAIKALRIQDWFYRDWWTTPCITIGRRTRARAIETGRNVVLSKDPPAADIVPYLPKGRGLWLSGVEVAVDISGDPRLPELERIPVYDVVRDEREMSSLQTALKQGEIGSAFITSERTLREISDLKPAGSGDLSRFAVLGPRLHKLTEEIFPHADIHLVTTLETGVEWLLKGA